MNFCEDSPGLCKFGIQFGNMPAFADETVVHHHQRINRFLDTGRAQRMPGEGFGGTDNRHVSRAFESLTDRFELLNVAGGRTRAVSVDVIHGSVDRRQGLTHAADGAFT